MKPKKKIRSLLNGLKNLLGVGIYLLVIGILLEVLTIVIRSRLSFSISIPSGWQIALTLVCVIFCMSGMVWFNKTLNLIRIHIAGGENKLMKCGPFNYVRHPLYATLMIALPPLMIIWFEDILFIVPWILIFVIAHNIIKIEEQGLVRIFGEEYEKYKEFVPELFPYKGSAGVKFREYRKRAKAKKRAKIGLTRHTI